MKRVVAPREAGFVSLFTVIFFMLLITIITIGFLRIMGIEQQQALDNDLTASAINAAESGVEDGKRAILSYNSTSNSALKSALAAAFTSTQCDSLTGSATIRNALNLDASGNVIGNAQLNQYYTCLTVNLNSPNYINGLSAGESDFIPLISADPASFERVKVSWHLISQNADGDGDGVPTNYTNDTYLRPLVNVNGNPTNSWTSQGYPAYLRVQFYGYPNNTSFGRAEIDQRTHTLLLVPTINTNPVAVDENTPIDMGVADPRGFDQSKAVMQLIKCRPNPAANVGSYACAATLELPNNAALRGPNNSYYMRVTPIYGQTHFSLVMQHNGSPVDFKGVQPIVDATGRAADIFRRIQARIRINPPGLLPNFAAESANTICKNMIVSDGSYYNPNDCP